MYEYTAKIVSVYDGDTFDFYVDLGFDVWVKSKLRLHGVDTPEVRGTERPEGLVVRDYVRELILHKLVRIVVYKKGKYGRYVADVFYKDENDVEFNLSEHLISLQYATRLNYD
jgi:micrococcal nuclease